MAHIAVIGLGRMGLPMAANLVKAGHAVTGYDLAAANRDEAALRGVAIAADAVAAARGAVAVITMVPAGKDTIAIYDSGVPEAAAEDAVMIDCSTIDVASARDAHDLAEKAGRLSLDCPVSGGVAGAEAATLTLMAGGSAAAFEAAKPILAAVSKRVVHCGAAGSGQAAKICNNMILGISMIAVAEGFVLAEKLGLSHQALYDVASTSSGQCWSLTSYCPVPGPVPASPANRGYEPGFAAALMLKDLLLAADSAQDTGAGLALGPAAAALFQNFVDNGAGGKDFSAIIEAIRTGTLSA
jgi:3-hydroxyisobutyrate dehydrogenase